MRCGAGAAPDIVEHCYWETLSVLRNALEMRRPMVEMLAARLSVARERLDGRRRTRRETAPEVERVYEIAARHGNTAPEILSLVPGTKTTLRDELGRVLGYYNRASQGAVVVAAADLLGSTSIAKAAEGFPAGFYHRTSNAESRLLSIGGICEDAMAGVLSGIASFGGHVGAGASYGAFIAALGHIASRLHAIGNQARVAVHGGDYRPFFLVCAHAGLKTGEDGPTHADPQALQLLQDNFPAGTMITLTPWEPQELWPLVSAALARRPAVIAPFVTRPPEIVPDRAALRIPAPSAAAKGVYRLRRGSHAGSATVVLQGSGVTYAFMTVALPLLEREGIDLNAYVVTSSELFDALPVEERESIFPESHQFHAIGITDFTLPTLLRWVRTDHGRFHSLHPFRGRHFLGSGSGAAVMAEAGLDGESQFEAIREYVRAQ
jgi:transketolase